MRILLAHNYYGSAAPSGENMVFDIEGDLLRRRGHEVSEFTRHSDEIRCKGVLGLVQGALSTPWNPWAARAMRERVEQFRPDVVHAHNTFPLLSPSIFHAIGNRAVRVLTLHNHRLFCAAGVLGRTGRVCTECLDKQSILPSLKYGCYRDSRIATAPLAANIALHGMLGTWNHEVEAFIALTEFQKKLLVGAGLPEERVYVKPNFFVGSPQPIPWNARDEAVVFAGRLSTEKGVESLINAWLAWNENAPELQIIGDGPLGRKLADLVQTRGNTRIRFLGWLSESETQHHIARARLLVVPSVWFEGFPMVLREAFAFGTPVAVSDIGPLPSIVRDGISGLVFTAGNADSLLGAVRTSWKSGNLEQLGRGARAEFEVKYNEEVNYKMLMDIYARAEVSRRSRH